MPVLRTKRARKKKRFVKLVSLGLLGAAAFAYRQYRLDNAPEPSWDSS